MSSSRLALNDWSLELRLPTLPHSTSPNTPDHAALHAAATPSLDQTEAYTGSTVLLLLTVTAPHNVQQPLQTFVQNIADPHVFLTPPPSAPSPSGTQTPTPQPTRLPILTESTWLPLPGHPATLVKALWALLRAPPEHSYSTLSGRHDLSVTLRERLNAAGKNSPVWATLDRASRLFGKTPAVRARKPLHLVCPVDIACEATSVCASADRPLFTVAVRNATPDAVVALAAPRVNLAASRIIHGPAGMTPAAAAVPGLERHYEAVALFDAGGVADESDTTSEVPPATVTSSTSVPEPGALPEPALRLAPREAVHFVFRIGRRAADRSAAGDWLRGVPSLKGKEAVRTAVTVAWSARRGGEADVPDGEALRRELSAGGVLAGARRGNVAVRIAAVEWRPVALLRGVVMSFAGPGVLRVGSRASIAIRLFNRAEETLRGMKVIVQGEDGPADLLALRTVIAVGEMAAGAETSLQLPVVPMRAGTLALGGVRVVAEAQEGEMTWVAESEFQVVAVDRGEASASGTIEDGSRALENVVAR